MPTDGHAAAIRPGAVALLRQLSGKQGRALIAAHDTDTSGLLTLVEAAGVEDSSAKAALAAHEAAAAGLSVHAAADALFRHAMGEL